tara:strand:+ start:3434 stop:3592 length:159 start_codon:yes stop_codon:yes gene_type:complete
MLTGINSDSTGFFYIAGQPTIAVIAIKANQNKGSYFLITFGSLSITHILVFV